MTEKKEQPISVDDQFLKDFLAKGGKAETTTGRLVDDGNVDALLEEAGKNGGTPKQAALHQKAINRGLADTTKEDAAIAQKEQDRNDRLRAAELKKQRGKTLDVAAKTSGAVRESVVDPVISRAGTTVDRVASLRTVGGIGLLLAILVFLLFVVVQVNAAGDTRIKQFWYMLNGRAHLVGRQMVGTGSSTTAGVPGAVNSNGTVNGPNGQPVTLPSIGAQDTQAIQNSPIGQFIESEYRTLFG